MKVAVCGAVGWSNEALVAEVLDRLLVDHGDIAVLTGMADGADAHARRWAASRDVRLFAECLEPGDYPGPMHAYNERLLAEGPNLVLAFKQGFDPGARPRGHEPGTEHLVRLARQAGINVGVYLHDDAGPLQQNEEERMKP